ncbi:MAG: hypothetical protein LBC82_01265 [Oscillospiraceae bacterium]|jgi:hypothetical protein|nr:hypothetical protein [Oscillospiraceae bacterium]
MQVIGELPLSALGGLLSYAYEKELEKTTYPLWLAHYLFSQLSGTEHVGYAEMLGKIKSVTDTAATPSNRTAEDILKDFAPIIEHHRKTMQ